VTTQNTKASGSGIRGATSANASAQSGSAVTNTMTRTWLCDEPDGNGSPSGWRNRALYVFTAKEQAQPSMPRLSAIISTRMESLDNVDRIEANSCMNRRREARGSRSPRRLATRKSSGTLASYAWERFLLDMPRLVRGVPLTLAGAPLFLLIEGLFAADQHGYLWRSALARLGAYLLICAGLIGAIRLDPALGFLSLLLPIEVLLFLAVAALAWQIDRQRRQFSLSSAILATLILGWAIAAVSPSSDRCSGALAPANEA